MDRPPAPPLASKPGDPGSATPEGEPPTRAFAFKMNEIFADLPPDQLPVEPAAPLDDLLGPEMRPSQVPPPPAAPGPAQPTAMQSGPVHAAKAPLPQVTKAGTPKAVWVLVGVVGLVLIAGGVMAALGKLPF